MMIKVYFGPLRHSPAPELPLNERVLWVMDFHLLRGFDRDFWTSNPLHLDVFDEGQVMLWVEGRWRILSNLADDIWPDRAHRMDLRALSVGRLALAALFTAELIGAEREAETRRQSRQTRH